MVVDRHDPRGGRSVSPETTSRATEAAWMSRDEEPPERSEELAVQLHRQRVRGEEPQVPPCCRVPVTGGPSGLDAPSVGQPTREVELCAAPLLHDLTRAALGGRGQP